jgi:hypothetical protein
VVIVIVIIIIIIIIITILIIIIIIICFLPSSSFIVPCPSSLSFLRLAPDAAFFHLFSTVSCPFKAEVRSNLPLLRPTLSIGTCHS